MLPGCPVFLRMVKDCEKGKIDLIITKSISRFARNTIGMSDICASSEKITEQIFYLKIIILIQGRHSQKFCSLFLRHLRRRSQGQFLKIQNGAYASVSKMALRDGVKSMDIQKMNTVTM